MRTSSPQRTQMKSSAGRGPGGSPGGSSVSLEWDVMPSAMGTFSTSRSVLQPAVQPSLLPEVWGHEVPPQNYSPILSKPLPFVPRKNSSHDAESTAWGQDALSANLGTSSDFLPPLKICLYSLYLHKFPPRSKVKNSSEDEEALQVFATKPPSHYTNGKLRERKQFVQGHGSNNNQVRAKPWSPDLPSSG